MRKAQSISINTIIVAAIALIVLVVIVMIFTGRITVFGKGLDQVQGGQKCEAPEAPSRHWRESCLPEETQVYGVFSDSKDNPDRVCCKSA